MKWHFQNAAQCFSEATAVFCGYHRGLFKAREYLLLTLGMHQDIVKLDWTGPYNSVLLPFTAELSSFFYFQKEHPESHYLSSHKKPVKIRSEANYFLFS